jgi:NAD(P)-dependent dehydrogenase (short-subunit alcohol dehydrogenase family)
VISLHPTGVNTPMNDGLAALEGMSTQQIADRSAVNLLPIPWIEPEDVAAAVVYLISDRARYITGSQFVLDAGLLTRRTIRQLPYSCFNRPVLPSQWTYFAPIVPAINR